MRWDEMRRGGVVVAVVGLMVKVISRRINEKHF
jgi:hypothetical protein